MPEETIFNGETTPEVVPNNESVTEQTPVTAPVVADYSGVLATITNEEGSPKYSDVESALGSIPHAQKHISTLEAENAKLQEELTKRAAAEDILQKFQEQSQATPVVESLDAGKIAAIVEQVVGNKEALALSQANQAKVVAALTDKFGDGAETKYKEVGAKYGLGVNTLNELAAKSPQAALALFDTTIIHTPAPSTGSVSTETFQAGGSNTVDTDALKRASGPCTTKQGIAAWREAGKLVQQNNQS